MKIMSYIQAVIGAFALFFISSSAFAISETAPPENEKWSVLVSYEGEACPPGLDGEIVVCAQEADADRFRIPKKLRAKEAEVIKEQSWSNAVTSLDETARLSRPNSCSAVGSNGFSGCPAAALRQWFAQRRLDGVR
jgi:hypothetical protein